MITKNKKPSYVMQPIILLAITLIAFALKFFFNVFLARHLRPGLYGDFVVGLRTFSLISAILLLGTGTAAKNFLSLYLKENDQHDVEHYISWNVRLLLVSSIIFLFVLLFFFLALLLLHLLDLKSIDTYHLAIYLLFFSPLGAIAILIASYLQSNNNIYWSTLLQNVARYILFFGLLVPGIYFLDLTLDNEHLILIVAIVFIVLVFLELFVFMLRAPNISFKRILAKKSQKVEHTAKWKKAALKLITNQILFMLLSTIDIYLVEIFTHNEHDVDKYAAILVTASLIWVITQALYSFITPLISYSFKNDKKNLQRAINSSSIFNLIINAIMLPLLIIFLHKILYLFGHDYFGFDTFWCFVILAISYSIGSFCKPAVLLLSYAGGFENYLIYGAIIEFSILIIAGIILTIFYGIVGMAIATCAAIVLKTIFFILITHLRLKFKTVLLV